MRSDEYRYFRAHEHIIMYINIFFCYFCYYEPRRAICLLSPSSSSRMRTHKLFFLSGGGGGGGAARRAGGMYARAGAPALARRPGVRARKRSAAPARLAAHRRAAGARHGAPRAGAARALCCSRRASAAVCAGDRCGEVNCPHGVISSFPHRHQSRSKYLYNI